SLTGVMKEDFVLFNILPGDPARLLLPKGRFQADMIPKQREAFHLDEPLYMQFARYWVDTPQLRFGYSWKEKRPVTEVVGERIWPTVLLVGVGTLVSVVIGFFTGVIAGWRRNSTYDVVSTNTGMVLYSMPSFWVAMLAIQIFAVALGWFPVGKMEAPGVVYPSWFAHSSSILWHMILPVVIFGITYAGEYHLIMRSSLTGVMKEDFVLTARAKGLSDDKVLWRHTVPNALLPSVTLIMMNFGFVLSGAILIETVFDWPGLGLLSWEALSWRDFPVLRAVFLLGAIAVIIFNLIADILYYYLDPRVQA
ncbi:MAG TPA: ABC transporter permease, partial [Thermoleophilia bacterium]|nr:ABC transporter permease [Thermoleophilia bacterium]